jgi:uncharacterized protein YndB with AHSA1/START domain
MNNTKFIKDFANRKILIERMFNAPIKIVWKAWTDPEILDQWWAPKPWKARTKQMDFREGGYWLYSMKGPDGDQVWSRADYEKIISLDSFSGTDSFCDEEGNRNTELPVMHWEVSFIDEGSATKIEILISFPSEEAMMKIIEMGFEEGFSSAHANLDGLLDKELLQNNDPGKP